MPRERLVPSDNETVRAALAHMYREWPEILPQLALLEYAPVGEPMALLNTSDTDREARVARMIFHGGSG